MIRAVALFLLLLLYTFTWLSTRISLYATHNCVAAAVSCSSPSYFLHTHPLTRSMHSTSRHTAAHNTLGTCTTSTTMMMILCKLSFPAVWRAWTVFRVSNAHSLVVVCLSCVEKTISEVKSKITTKRKIFYTIFLLHTGKTTITPIHTRNAKILRSTHTTCTRDTDTVRTRYWKSCGFSPRVAEYTCCNFDGAMDSRSAQNAGDLQCVCVGLGERILFASLCKIYVLDNRSTENFTTTREIHATKPLCIWILNWMCGSICVPYTSHGFGFTIITHLADRVLLRSPRASWMKREREANVCLLYLILVNSSRIICYSIQTCRNERSLSTSAYS